MYIEGAFMSKSRNIGVINIGSSGLLKYYAVLEFIVTNPVKRWYKLLTWYFVSDVSLKIGRVQGYLTETQIHSPHTSEKLFKSEIRGPLRLTTMRVLSTSITCKIHC